MVSRNGDEIDTCRYTTWNRRDIKKIVQSAALRSSCELVATFESRVDLLITLNTYP